MAGITRFEEIEAWKTSRQLTGLVYRLSEQGMCGKDYGLKDQIRRASVFVMSNIAEGFERGTTNELLHVLRMGSLLVRAGEFGVDAGQVLMPAIKGMMGGLSNTSTTCSTNSRR